MKDKSFAISFSTEYDQNWLKRCLRKPISKLDKDGYVYVYYRAEEQEKKKANKTMAFKIGRSIDAPKRISHSSKKNNEKYNTAIIEKTSYYKHFEGIIHDYLKEGRIIRNEIKDGKTEWFFTKFSDIEEVIKKCIVYLRVCHGDKGDRD